ncbi:transporter substrate-binding domain-containing protein [Chelatococcus sp. YT9]|nr:transporter substrate-binding domain-containing protein [Chelatococcus sp. YT9]MBS7696739.1 transporter substrate-binding domain-containing protein [Chelatococcus sp. YT9]MBX3555304.1 transporter substrate-binding domain-containing protein [Chelatococcus sp.]
MTAFFVLALSVGISSAQEGRPRGVSDEVAVPNFWNRQNSPNKPDLTGLRVIRFLTDDLYPPLHFADAEGLPTGFSVDLARAVCDVLQVACTIQVRRFDTLLESLAESRGDAIAAAIPIREDLRQRFSVTSPYYRTPARFVARAGGDLPEPTVEAIVGRTVGVVERSAHRAYLKATFPGAKVETFINLGLAQDALRDGKVDYVFADGLSMALWLNGSDAAGCCRFIGGPYTESRYFGEGVGFITRRDDPILRQALDYGLQKVWEDGTYAELYLRYFPVSFY